MPIVKHCLICYGRSLKRQSMSTFPVPIVYQKILWSVIVRGSE